MTYTIRKHLLLGLRIAGPSGVDDPEKSQLHMGVRKDLPHLHSIVSKGLEAVTEDELQTISQRWLSDEAMQPPAKQSIQSDGTFRGVLVAASVLCVSNS